MATTLALDKLEIASIVQHYLFPALTFVTFITAVAITVCIVQAKSLRVRDERVRRDVVFVILAAVVLSYLAEGIISVVRTFSDPKWSARQDYVVYLMGSILVFVIQILILSDAKFPVWYPYYITWFMEILMESTLLVCATLHSVPKATADYATVTVRSLRILTFVALASVYFGLRTSKKQYDVGDTERQSLLSRKLAPKPSGSEMENGYGGTDATPQQTESTDNASEADSDDSWFGERKLQAQIAKRLESDGNWWTYAKGFSVLFPHIWPVHSKRLQFRAVLVGCCLLAANALNLLLPRQLGIMIDTLQKYSIGEGTVQHVWLPVVIYAILRFADSGSCLKWLQNWLWLPLEQYSYDALSTASHSHIMRLSSDFHDSKETSDLTMAIAGGRSVADLLDIVCFQMIPMLIDLGVAFAYLWSLFGPYMGFTMATTAISYLYLTSKLIAAKSQKRREFITVYRKEWEVGHQSMEGWNTASLFNMIPYEEDRYQCAVKAHMKQKMAFDLSAGAADAAQNLLMAVGLLGALYIGVYQVIRGGKTVGQFATLTTYWAQFTGPLFAFSGIYRRSSYALMDAERLLELLQTKPSIKDAPNAKPIKFGDGKVEFDRVVFAYDERKPTLRSVSFTAQPGQTVALVGETGGGKSTILKLIDRFYDVKSGSIRIDGQDIRDVTLNSVRSKIGVVPQEPLLFNDSVMNNLRYARQTATDEEVYEACKAAAIHEKIMTFPDGYNSKVGERGIKLSGGEKQRIAVARAMLKQPEIILLDEATSAVDTETEQLIQEGLKVLCQGRTTFVVAHRLSTIMRADHILVVMNGEITEEGCHRELLSAKGKYYDLWTKQVFLQPSSERSRSRSPKKLGNIVNDISPALHKAEVKKANELHKTEAAKLKKDLGNPETDGHRSDDENITHKQEGSKLKPDAPEFVPRGPDSNIALANTKPTGKGSSHKNSADESASTGVSNETDSVEISGHDKLKTRQARTSRRQQSKSEPGRVQDSMDSAQDSDMGLDNAGDSASIAPGIATRRRVSAPSDPPGGSQDGRGNRGRRSRHWRLKNRATENRSATGSRTTASVEQSINGSGSHDAHHTTPAEPALASSATSTVRFAPGV
ncbi:p-loop containing nucleoside triphosphate hydrolase-10 [Coleophoma crateriformis]|uniref:p-loop containing nucleoside triphosphate hydrolase-10 n=1 Tax=Coleophoma crateriformis TaxID=565419 RepID=A0A3D8T730_9HELO|nr:p-loop containing nucleoside triphosphate hydrolase-10 [Coleophoma crateriformis]